MTAALFDAAQYRPVHISYEIGSRRPSRQAYCHQVTEWFISPNEARRIRGSVALCAGCVAAYNATSRKGWKL